MTPSPQLLRRGSGPVLMLVTEARPTSAEHLSTRVDRAIAGGVNVIQLRCPELSSSELLTLARRLRSLTVGRALLIVNDRADVAMLAGADGVQLPESGLPTAAVRSLLPASLRVGRSVHSVNAARQAEADGADYVIVGTLFPSSSHPGGEARDAGLLRDLGSRIAIPFLGIGGIGIENARECRLAGATGVAAISAFHCADPADAASKLLEQLTCDSP